MDRLTYERTSMGLFDLFKKSFKEATPEALVVSDYTAKTIYAPASGKVVALENVPDPVFAGGMLGQGLGIWPSEGVVYAPVSGTITATTPTVHAFGITADSGEEVLIHVGVDTVEMKGDGFTALVEQDQRVEVGQPLMTFDLDKVKDAGHPEVVILAITNSSEYSSVEVLASADQQVSAGEKVCVLA